MFLEEPLDTSTFPEVQATSAFAVCIEDLSSADDTRQLRAIKSIRNAVIGSDRQKSAVLQLGIVPKLLKYLDDASTSPEACLEICFILGSLAKGSRQQVAFLVAAGVVPCLLKGLTSSNLRFVEACLRCLRSIFTTDCAPVEQLYLDSSVIFQLLNSTSRSCCTMECVATIVARCCLNSAHQRTLLSAGAVDILAPLLVTGFVTIQVPTIRAYSALCYRNYDSSTAVASACYNKQPLIELFAVLMNRDKSVELQIAAAKCLTHICRSGVLREDDDIAVLKVMPTLVRGCTSDPSITSSLRVEAAETLAYLIEANIDLQRITATNNHCLNVLLRCLSVPTPDSSSYADLTKFKQDTFMAEELRQAAMKAIAAISSGDEEIRRKIITMEAPSPRLLDIIEGLSPPNETRNPKIQLAALKCLHSLSRSVEQLRTTFHDCNVVWRPLLQFVKSSDDDLCAVASATLCNLILEFAPYRSHLYDAGVVDVFAQLVKRDDLQLKLNGVWGLMNLAYKADAALKLEILNHLRIEGLLRILTEAPTDSSLALLILGLIRNLVATRPHVDLIMSTHGTHVMQATIFVLEENYGFEVKEVALSILVNVADGDSSKAFIMSNEDILRKIISYMTHSTVRLQTVATFCICNLMWKEDMGSQERQVRLKDLGCIRILQQLLNTPDSSLYDKVRLALQQCSQ